MNTTWTSIARRHRHARHIEVDDHGLNALPSTLVEAASKYFKTSGPRPALNEIADMYRECKMAAVVFTVDASSHLGHPPNSSEEIARGAAENNDVLIPFGPWIRTTDPRPSTAPSG